MNDARFEVCGLGNALVDALVRIDDDAVLAQLAVNRGHMTPVDHDTWQAAFNLLQVHGVTIQSGGSCANTIATLGLMGARAVYCGQVGDDQLGHLYASRMAEACGGHALHYSPTGHTGKCLSIISAVDAERTMLTDLGTAIQLAGLGTFADDIAESGMLHLTGYLLLGEPMAERAMEAIAVANQHEIPISIDVADPFVVSQVKGRMWDVISEFADIVFLNAEEGEVLTGKSPEEAVHLVAEHCDTVVLKLGAHGSLVHADGELIAASARKVHAIDTTGAGDAYAAGFLYGRIRGWSAQRSAELGSRVAALTVSQVGAVVRDRDVLAAAVAACGGAASNGGASGGAASISGALTGGS